MYLLSSFFLLFCYIDIRGCVKSTTIYRGSSDMKSLSVRKTQRNPSYRGWCRNPGTVHGKLKTHHYTGRSYSSRTWACSVQQDKCQSQKAVGMCPPGFGDPDNMAMAQLCQLTPSFRHELASKGVAKNPGCSSHLCHGVSVLHFSGHLLYCSEDHLDCTVVWVHCGVLQDYLGGGIKH